MNVFLIILAVLFILIGIVLLASIRVKIYLSDEGYVVFKYLFLRFCFELYGNKKIKPVKKRKKGKKAKASSQSEGYVKKLYKKHGVVEGTVELLDMIKTVFSALIELLGQCKVKRLNINVTVTAEESASTAILYGGVCAVLYPAVGIINGITTVEKQSVNVNADYGAKDSEFDFSAVISLRVFKAIKVAVSLVKNFL